MSERLPPGWKQDRLDSVAELERATVVPQAIRKGTKYVGLEHIDSSGAFLRTPEVDEGELASNKFVFTQQHLLYGKLRPYLTKIARPDFSGVCSTEIIPIRTNGKLDRNYLYYYLRQPRMVALAITRTAGANLPRLSPNDLASFPIRYPESLSEQRRIVNILDETDALRLKRSEVIWRINNLMPSLFNEKFGDPVGNPKGRWKPKLLRELVRNGTDVTYGIVQCGPHVNDGVPYVRTSDMTADQLDVSQMGRTAPEVAAKFTRSRVEKDELVISIRASVGAVHIVPAELDGGNLTQGTARIAPGPDVNNLWLLWGLRSTGAQRWLTQQCKGTTFREITLGRLRELPFAIPPRELQDIFARFASAASDTLTKAKQSEKELDSLFNSLLQRAFQGGL